MIAKLPALSLALSLLVPLALAGCVREDAADDDETAPAADVAATSAVESAPAEAAVAPSVPMAGFRTADAELLERERNETSWRDAAERERRRGREPRTADAAAGETPLDRLRRGATSAGEASPAEASADAEPAPASESWEDLSAEAMERPPVLPVPQSGGGPTVLRVQWMLDRVGFSPGVLDGRWGKNTEKAVYWLEDELGLEPDGEVDGALFDRLAAEVSGSPLRSYTVTAADVAGPFVDLSEEPAAMAELDCLCYESPAELLAERFHTTRELLEQLNPGVDLAAVAAGDVLDVPAVETAAEVRRPESRIARLVVSNDGRYLHALDAGGAVLHHYPTTVGSGYDASPEGTLEVDTVAFEPDFHYQPALFHDVPDAEEDALLPPGPNSPVGEVWIQLSKENYGIHGTAAPETIGYTSSHGCIRLTNWDAVHLASLVPAGTPVEFTGTAE